MAPSDTAPTATRKRFTKAERLAQLLDVARQLVRDDGTDALTLGRLAEAAGITKPTVYDHFGTRHGLLAALYQEFDIRQNQILDEAFAASPANLEDRARVVACSYIECVLAEGREIPGVLAALDGSPELAALKRNCQKDFISKCHVALKAFAGPEGLPKASLWAMLGAADSLSNAAVSGDLPHAEACDELYEIVMSLVERSHRPHKEDESAR